MPTEAQKIKQIGKLVQEIIHACDASRPAIGKKTGLDGLELQLKHLLKELKEKSREKKYTNKRIAEILESITALANLDYSKKLKPGKKGNLIDALALGVNMLGEELQASTISLNEKELLLKEIHHRVKNNLQLVSSLLSLQATFISDPEAIERFRESRDRIKSIALLHEKLYETKDLNRINMSEYIHTIVDNISRTFATDSSDIKLNIHIKVKDPYFSLDTALPCGLILNELLTNSFKYAFNERKKGSIEVLLKQTRDIFTLSVADDGPGLPQGLDINNTNTLGLQLVTTLAEQLQANLKTEKCKGTCFKIEFKNVE